MWAVKISDNCVVEPVLAEEKLHVCPECGMRKMRLRDSPRCRSCARKRDWAGRGFHGHK